jgi:tubulin-specific chaperone A
MSTAEIVRQLQIKTKALDRLHKELQYYIKEKEKEHVRVERMKAENADPHDLKQAVSTLKQHANQPG